MVAAHPSRSDPRPGSHYHIRPSRRYADYDLAQVDQIGARVFNAHMMARGLTLRMHPDGGIYGSVTERMRAKTEIGA